MLNFLVFTLYRFLIVPIGLWLLYFLFPFWPSKLKQILIDRREVSKAVLPARCIWVHASSGEVEYAKPVIRELKERYPQIPILLTYFSPSAKKLVAQFKFADLILPLPFDSRGQMQKFVQRWKPIACLIAKTDVWPEMSYQLKKQKVPTLLFSATFSELSSFRKWALSNLESIYCASAKDLEKISDLKIDKKISGDTRYDQVLDRIRHPKELKTSLKPHRKALVAGSTWPEDEAVLLPAIKNYLTDQLFLIIAPHECNEKNISRVEKSLANLKIKSQRYTPSTELKSDTQALIIDQVGILPELYAWGDLSFVGGSFKARVHSVMEPLACGLPVIVGPHYQNNREAQEFTLAQISSETSVVRSVNSVEQMDSSIRALLHVNEKKSITDLILKKSKATKEVIDWVQPHIR